MEKRPFRRDNKRGKPFAKKKNFRREREGDDKERRSSDSDRKPSREFGTESRGPYKKKSYGDRDDKRPYNSRQSVVGSKKKFDKDRKPYDRDRKPFDRDRKPFSRDRKPYSGERGPYKKKPYGDRDEKRPFKRDGDRKPFDRDKKPFDRDRKPFSRDRKPYSGERGPYKKKPYGDRDEKRPFKRDGDRKPFDRDKKPFDRDKKPFDKDRKPYDRDRKPFDRDKKPFDRDRKPFGERRGPYKKKPYGDRDEKRPFKRDGDRKPFDRDKKPFDRDKKPFDKDRKPYDRDRKPFINKRPGEEKPYEEREDRFKKFERSADEPVKKAVTIPEESSPTEDQGLIRLNKYIANAGVCSRREADELIAAGAVKVNGIVITQMGFKVKAGDVVNFGGETLNTERKRYVLLNKPKDYITTTDDPEGRKNVMMLVEHACRERIYPVGRLDRGTTGVLLFTNDGDLAKKLTHPKYEVAKMYFVELDKSLAPVDLEAIQNGIQLDDGAIRPDVIEFVGDGTNKREIGIEIHSGRNRIVRRMFESLGYRVVRLDRVMFAGLTKKDVSRGSWRHLTDQEVGFLKMKVGKVEL